MELGPTNYAGVTENLGQPPSATWALAFWMASFLVITACSSTVCIYIYIYIYIYIIYIWIYVFYYMDIYIYMYGNIYMVIHISRYT
jgi:cellulose synthase/poly-beta-1,6-N-acetylglucosamine synthase-like glycosyltransferase